VTGVTVVGVRGHLVAVEAHVGRGLPSLTLTWLPGAEGSQEAWPASSRSWTWMRRRASALEEAPVLL
jgi:hypothetical protein